MNRPFDLDKALKEGAVTRGGDPVHQLTHFPAAKQLAGVLDGEVETWTEGGSYVGIKDSVYDLLNLPPKPMEGWMAVQRTQGSTGINATTNLSQRRDEVATWVAMRANPGEWVIVKALLTPES